jgi:hypothetical protein
MRTVPELDDLKLAVLPPSEQERIRKELIEKSLELQPIAASVATQQTFIEIYEMVQKSARQRIK